MRIAKRSVYEQSDQFNDRYKCRNYHVCIQPVHRCQAISSTVPESSQILCKVKGTGSEHLSSSYR